jgi:hypothetical protein
VSSIIDNKAPSVRLEYEDYQDSTHILYMLSLLSKLDVVHGVSSYWYFGRIVEITVWL